MKATLVNPMGSLSWSFEYGDDETRVGGFDIRKDLLDGKFSIWNVEVYEPYRGLGHGRSLMVMCMNEIRNRGGNAAYLFVRANNYRAIKLYESLGFKATMSWASPRSVVRMEVTL